jgi:ATP-dependent DNA helicase 2 subunit 2
LSALAIAITQIDAATSGKNGNPLKYDRRIIIVTDGRGHMDTADLNAITEKITSYSPPLEVVLL